MSRYTDIVAARIAIKNGLASEAAVRACFNAQRAGVAGGELRDLIEILVDRGLVDAPTAKNLYRAVSLHKVVRADRVYTQVAVEHGYITAEQAKEALAEQRASEYRLRVADLLRQRGWITIDRADEVHDQHMMVLAEIEAREEEEFDAAARAALGDSIKIDPKKLSEGLRGFAGPSGTGAFSRSSLDIDVGTSAAGGGAGTRAGGEGRAIPAGVPRGKEALTQSGALRDPLIGQTVAGRYRVRSRLGIGRAGTVYLADHLLKDCPVALRVIPEDIAHDSPRLAALKGVLRATSRTTLVDVAEIFDADLEGKHGTPFVATELCRGEPLDRLLAREKALDPERAARLAAQVLAALHSAHASGVLHGDLAPSHVYIGRDRRGEERVKVKDFGLFRLFAPGRGGSGRAKAGAPHWRPVYASPEHAAEVDSDIRSETYVVGLILYEMLAGEPPFHEASPAALLRKHLLEKPPPLELGKPGAVIPLGLLDIVERALAKDPQRRFQTAAEMRDALEACIGDSGLDLGAPVAGQAVPAGVHAPAAAGGGGGAGLARPRRGGRLWRWLALAAAVAAAAAGRYYGLY